MTDLAEPMVRFEVEMTPEQYVAIKKDSDWQGMTVAKYIVAHALGTVSRGC